MTADQSGCALPGRAREHGYLAVLASATAPAALPTYSLATWQSPEVAMSELDDFLTQTLARQVEAEQATHNGGPTPRTAMWSTQDPVTLFGSARLNKSADGTR